MSKLTKNDLTVHDGDARVSDRRLADALGFNRVNDLHRLIKGHEGELGDFGEVFCFEAKNPSAKGGRPAKSYLLNEHQAVALAMWANTENARAARMQIIEVFVAWRRGDQASLARQSQRPDVFQQAAKRSAYVAEQVKNIGKVDDLTMRITHMPIWSNGTRPNFWSNVGLRELLTVSHRQMTLNEAHALAVAEYGEGCVSASAINRYWMKLDTVVGCDVKRPSLTNAPL